jgi:glycosyltransferase involved in cell wall biosynthesis
MKIGVAIPCYFAHISQLINLLDSIENQTYRPDKVVVSCSSTKDLFETKQYNFLLQIITTEETKNAAQNRNIAASYLDDMDYITFIDADDIMHPQRIEILLKVFQESNCDIIFHNFLMDDSKFDYIENIDYRINELIQCYSGCITHKYEAHPSQHIHHAQTSIKKYIFDIVKYPEEKEYYSREDCVFCYRILSISEVTDVYITNPLSLYKPSGTQCQ